MKWKYDGSEPLGRWVVVPEAMPDLSTAGQPCPFVSF
jgi:hypothetical protein